MLYVVRTVVLLAVSVALALGGLGGFGCESDDQAQASPGVLALCAGCGQLKGDAACCAPGAQVCADCGLAKGSPGCCKIDHAPGQTVALCADCGMIKGTAGCCDADATRCASCGMIKGSVACCKVK